MLKLFLFVWTPSSSQIIDLNSTLLELVSLKNLKKRYDFVLNEIPNRFAPENEKYYQGLIIEG